uniref:Sensory/regulatory protein RpfC n=1 Tax=Magnetococcus massalia (strain MO-1) TaxID=451514 RepID=A0A1S7LQC9_MAGMO|nr:Protein of unknown function. putative Histidine kinase [Candidatus Magnetococcus massalia]
MSLKARFLLMMTMATGLVLVGMELYLDHFLSQRMREQVQNEARVILEFATASRAYVREELRPALDEKLDDFLLEAESSTFVTTHIFRQFNNSGLGYQYRQPSLNPLNRENLPTPFEREIIKRFQRNQALKTISETVTIEDESHYVSARPVVITVACLQCHGEPEDAPAPILSRYGSDSGFGWQPGEVISATVVTIPMDQHKATYQHLSGVVLPIAFLATVTLLMLVNHTLFEQLINRRLSRLMQVVDGFFRADGAQLRCQDHHHDEIGSLGSAVNRMAEAVTQSQGRLEQHVTELRESNRQLSTEVSLRHHTEKKLEQLLHEQQTISILLQAAHRAGTMEEKLQLVMDKLTTFPWLSLESKGSIFLADEQNKKLHMVVQKDLAKPLLTQCRTLDYGQCLCGQAAQSQEIVFESHVGHNHDIRFPGMHDHGHYCVPILSDEKLLGVLNLYVVAGYEPNKQDTLFLQTIVDALSHIIMHIQYTEQMAIAREQAEAARLAAESANEAKSQFLANVSHEIRTPLNAILGIGELLSESALDATQSDYIQTLNRAGNGLLGIISDVLDYSKIEAGEMQLDPVPFLLPELLSETHDIIALSVRGKGLEMPFITDGTLQERVIGDPLRLKQILLNLLSNAVKFTHEGSVTLKAEGLENNFYRFSVIDSGIGIPSQRLRSIFEPFAQVDGSTTRQFGGTGLGLAICKQLVEQMSGSMHVSSQEGIGSTFSFTAHLPQTEREAHQEYWVVRQNMRPKGDAVDHHEGQGLTLLVVDDAEDNRKLIAAYLKKTVHQLSFATNGLEALEQATLQGRHFDLILMDVQMPQMDGLQATRLIRSWEQDSTRNAVPIIALTAHASPDDRDKALAAGCDFHVTKPLRKTRLLSILADFMTRQEEVSEVN